MLPQLKCVIVDDDRFVIERSLDILNSISYVKISNNFNDPNKFLEALPSLDFDVCLLDICRPGGDGLFVAKQIKGKQVIYVTAQESIFKDAHTFAPIDIMVKPVDKYKLNEALSKAYYNISYKEKKPANHRKEYESFCTNQGRNKVLLKLADIFFVYSDNKDPRNKHVLMKDGNTHILMNCTFEYLLALAPGLVRINGSELILLELIKDYGYDVITIEFPLEKNKVKQLTLGRTFKKEFHNRVSSL
jgi:DNA-binding LytR/AlgR family response regulator